MRTEEGSVSEVTASRSSRERNITTEQNLQNCSSTSTHGIVTQLARGNCVVGSSPTYPKRLLMERAKTLVSTMLSKIVMQTTKTGTDKCKAGLYATLIIKYWDVV